jgi:hypothetical protein
MQAGNSLSQAYRTTFGAYASKLDALQRLLDSGGPDNGRLETIMQEVEQARQEHNSARDELARELGAGEHASKLNLRRISLPRA